MESATAPPTSRVGSYRPTIITRYTTATQGTPPMAIKDSTIATGHSPAAKTTPSPPSPTAPEPLTLRLTRTPPVLTPTAAPPPPTDTEVANHCQDHTTTHVLPTQRLYHHHRLASARTGPANASREVTQVNNHPATASTDSL
ncbi:hypothetical protein C0992_010651 [Termitomyces sp. T32_za158]|nr:hypothetical protein C0992_010651 [Termitomyces sp. T32_za158]